MYGMKKNAGNKPPDGKITKPVNAQKPRPRKRSMSKEVRSVMSHSKNVSAKYKGPKYPYAGQGMA